MHWNFLEISAANSVYLQFTKHCISVYFEETNFATLKIFVLQNIF